MRKRFDNLLRQAGVEHCGIHSLRHTFASKLYELTRGDSKLVSELIRHSSVSFTEEIYIHLKDKYKSNTIQISAYEKRGENELPQFVRTAQKRDSLAG